MMNHTPSQQTGATLIVALVFLVVLTIAGITAMQFSTLEERMASNSQFRNETFQQAQSSIQANLIALSANATGRDRLLSALNAASNSSADSDCDEDYPFNLCTQKLEQLGLQPTAKQAIDAIEDQTANLGFSVIRNTAPAKACEDDVYGASSITNFECINYELQIREELPNGAYSDQSQGLTFMNIKAKS
ncbi:MAG TPA: PilX N-terminal domain-containing pilus assembly protein [Pseudomonas sp.]|nr:PilX N-terminal domain-containing pilus assembly protein [Pseudomonas sp.]